MYDRNAVRIDTMVSLLDTKVVYKGPLNNPAYGPVALQSCKQLVGNVTYFWELSYLSGYLTSNGCNVHTNDASVQALNNKNPNIPSFT